ncbi:MAG: DUF3021 family protein [Clostridia bacterium]|nr:DUF3021 family protein [Clostridia bacterium]
MKKIKNTILNACAYTVILLFVFFFFVALTGSTNLALTISSFTAIFFIGCVIALSNHVFGIEKLAYPLRLTIHFFLLLGALFGLLYTTGYLASRTPSSYIVLIFIYALVYAIVWLISHFFKKWISPLTARTKKKNGKVEAEKKQTAEYKPLYK